MNPRWLVAVAVSVGMSLAPEARDDVRPPSRPPQNPAAQASTPAGRPSAAASPPANPADAHRAGAPPLFVRTIVSYRGRVWLGTFTDGLYVIDASPDELVERAEIATNATPLPAPFRMVNDAVAVGGSLYVAANEGLYVTRDGAHFQRIRQVDVRGVTALATDGHSLYATTTSALWRVRLEGDRRGAAVWWKPGGSRSLQGVIVEKSTVWLASEDRGAIRFDGKAFTAYDRLAGLPTSWVVAIAGDGEGGVYAATLRDGAMHLKANGDYTALPGLPSAWGLTVARADGEVCVGTQDGAACSDEARGAAGTSGSWQMLDRLPDRRVHAFLHTSEGLVVGTEAGWSVQRKEQRAGHREVASLAH
jgi:ligand-binding sensor domain-containing protein